MQAMTRPVPAHVGRDPAATMRAVTALPSVTAQRHHQENFPVASLLCPPAWRPAVLAIYAFARHADDIADEGHATPAQRQAALAGVRAQLNALPAHPDPSAAWASPLAAAMRAHALPPSLLHALLDAFEQDTHVDRYADRDGLLDYCAKSANPVGRLLLHLAGVNDAEALRQSDAICTGLQLVNFWQDVSVDRLKPRLYLPLADLQRHGVSAEDVLSGRGAAGLTACVAELTQWAQSLLDAGRPLPQRVGGRFGFELRLVVEGGTRIAEKIRAMDHATLHQRPRLRAWDAPLLLARALLWKAS